MAWNWQLPDWSNFRWDPGALVAMEQQFLLLSGELVGVLKHLQPADQDELTVQSLSSEAVTTSEIEGEILDRESVQSSIKGQLGISADKRRVTPAERGVAELMVDLHRSFAEPLSDEALFAWHRLLMAGRGDLRDLGRYRSDDEPMQVLSQGRSLDEPRVHFEAPPSERVPREMAAFIAWFNATGPTGDMPLPALVRSGMAHLYFESIHPFEDGNGRIGRALSEKAISQNLGCASYSSLASVILARRKAYYEALEQGSSTLDITAWLIWFAEVMIEAQHRTMTLVEFLIAKTRLFDRLQDQLNPRQERVLLRMFREGPEGFKGGLSASNYMKITGAPSATTTRDLADLVEKGALIRKGERRYARYYLAV